MNQKKNLEKWVDIEKENSKSCANIIKISFKKQGK